MTTWAQAAQTVSERWAKQGRPLAVPPDEPNEDDREFWLEVRQLVSGTRESVGRLREDYNPDEPRDEQGRWTSGGGDEGTSKDQTTSTGRPGVSIDPATGVPDHTAAILAEIQARGLSDQEAAQALQNGTIADTLTRNTTDGVLNADRQPVLNSGVAAVLDDHASQAQPTAVYTMGAAASGKGGLYGDRGTANGFTTPPDSAVIDPDQFKTGLDASGKPLEGYLGIPEYQGLKDAGYPMAASSAAHEESSQIAAAARDGAFGQNMNVVVDGVGGSDGKFAEGTPDNPGKIQTALNNGYNVDVRVATVPVETSIADAVARSEDPNSPSYGRVVEPDLIAAQHAGVGQTYINNVATMAGNIAANPDVGHMTVGVWERTASGYQPLVNIDSSGQLHVSNEAGYTRFLQRAQA